ncbi:type I phosphomannose isomerase catalytic subunit [Roseivirga pacifica]|uniref:type I phosphomannose isomerase catalytic subunit n=1 Tax=Roseivirga pacifica TaxID=1267423 RepID=UPI0020944A7B|nr:type I phosphomannose isomerase catalytic subunit [Roseivirga pacifica]MCO6359868.1 mannose-6-phosphate isomerase [Roseivirga pacifica]MCO6367238.1 mannose-6-phosphate isomerase [Roseivirga pacifica]MCO6370230.1 mannose-6-phosphate isomerase [Roseivirga pacifica]MCO6374895.1 mannose-6-phosphate isomerase [Roseivirga pacifica]MCO6380153.1 mannose-6-phosphate isomerase [Roseivirga pacifica]
MTKKFLYPLKFDTIFKDKIWGGEKINTILGKDFSPLPNCGETWEISGVPGNLSKVSEGPLKGWTLPELIEEFKEELVGKKVFEQYGTEFPLLVKFIDAAQDLSIQVHPNDKLAKARHNSLGKSEMWYIFQADEGAKLISGFNKDTNQQEYLEYLESGRLTEILNEEEVNAGDCFYLPAGRVHTIGKGLLLAEIQQSSDVTYRIYDFDRTDDQGNKRELHTEQALDALDYKHYSEYKTPYKKALNEAVPLVKSQYFQTNLLEFTTGIIREHYRKDSFVIYTSVQGEAQIECMGQTTKISMGNAVLIPQKAPEIHLRTNSGFKMLETFMP